MTKYINLTQFWQNPQIGSISNPRISKFSKTTKLIKLIYKNHQYSILEQKPIDQFHQKRFESSKTPTCEKCRKYPIQCMKSWNKMQKEWQKGLTGFERQKPCKNSGGKRQKIFGGALAKSEREEMLKNFLKKTIWPFKKHVSQVSIDQKTASIDRNKQRLYKKNLKQVRSIENQFRSIEIGRGSPNFEEKHNFWKTFRINSKHWNLRTKMHEYVMIWFSKQEF